LAEKFDLPNFKGRPLARTGNIIYYGNPQDDYIAMLTVLSTKKVEDITLSEKVLVQMLSTDDTLPITERILKKAEKNGLSNALDIASIWLDRMQAK